MLKKLDWLSILMFAITAVATALFYSRLSAPLYSPLNPENIFLGGSISLLCGGFVALTGLLAVCAQLPSLRGMAEDTARTLRFVIRCVLGILLIFYIFLLLMNSGYAIDSANMLVLMLSTLMLLIALQLPYLPPNNYIGFKFTWVMGDENCWRHTHRFMGYTGVPLAILQALLALFVTSAFLALLCGIGIWFIATLIYSFAWYIRHPPQFDEDGNLILPDEANEAKEPS